jgi:PAS domain-containing protein
MSGSGNGLDDHLRDLADHLSSALWVIDPDGSRMLYCSGAYETLWGRPLEELYADPGSWIAGVHPDDQVRVEALWHGRHEGYEAEYRVVRPTGASSTSTAAASRSATRPAGSCGSRASPPT